MRTLALTCLALLTLGSAAADAQSAGPARDPQQFVGEWVGEFQGTTPSASSRYAKGKVSLTIAEVDSAKGTFAGESHFDTQNTRNKPIKVKGRIKGDRLEYTAGSRKYALTLADASTLEGEGSSESARPPVAKITLRKSK